MGAFSYVRAMRVEVIQMGGVRRGAGRPVDPNSMRSQIKGLAGKEDFVTLPADGRVEVVPEWPLESLSDSESDLWGMLWLKPQSLMWEMLSLELSVAMYVRTFLEASEPKAVAALKTAALRMEGELGISLPGMKTLGWQIASDGVAEVAPMQAARRTTSGDWLKAVTVEGA